MEHLSHLPLTELVLEEGGWGPVLLVGRGGIPLLWGLNAKCILNKQVGSLISRYNCSQHFCAVPWPHGNVMGALCHAAACHLWALPLWGSWWLHPSVCPSESSLLSQARWLLGGTGLSLGKVAQTSDVGAKQRVNSSS